MMKGVLQESVLLLLFLAKKKKFKTLSYGCMRRIFYRKTKTRTNLKFPIQQQQKRTYTFMESLALEEKKICIPDKIKYCQW